MGAYTYFTDEEIEQCLTELEDIELKELIAETNKQVVVFISLKNINIPLNEF